MFLAYVSRSECIAGVDAIESPWDVAKVLSTSYVIQTSVESLPRKFRGNVRRGRGETNADFTVVVLLTAYIRSSSATQYVE